MGLCPPDVGIFLYLADSRDQQDQTNKDHYTNIYIYTHNENK